MGAPERAIGIMRVDIWSDVVCPWCYIGKRRFERALAEFTERDKIEVRWRAFELDPRAPAIRDGDALERLARKYGISLDQARAAQARMTEAAATEGLSYNLADARSGNTFDAHRLIHLAGERGCQDLVKERLLSLYLCEGQAIGDRDVLVRAGLEGGLDGDEVRKLLESDDYAEAVRADERMAEELDIAAVPFFVIDGKYGIPGAQEPQLLLRALRRAWESRSALELVDEQPGDACEGDSCAI